ncbi:FtsX-like permease family protein [Chryseolinea sp. T2]|uniref:ABC transporter permease n=1 Tax=Chryseolinea sp. T2 TaxID=3129255 RepID=UPI003076FA01
MRHDPPRLFTKLLHWFCPVEYVEEVEGDLHQCFEERVISKGLTRARLLYARDVIHAVRVYPTRNTAIRQVSFTTFVDAFRHFLTLAVRNMTRNKSTTAINIAGLAVSLASVLLIGLYIIDELSFDAFHPNADNVYRIGHSYKRYGDGVEETDARAAGYWAPAMKELLPGIKHVTRFSRFGYPGMVREELSNKVFVEPEFFWTDSTFTDIFYVSLFSGGNIREILGNPGNVILTEDMAKKYFGDADPQGLQLVYSRDGMDFPLIVAGVMKSFPSNSHFHPQFIASNQALNPLWKRDNEDRVNSWRDAFTYSYMEVEEGTSESTLAASLRKVFDEHLGDNAKFVSPSIVRMRDIHFTPGKVLELEGAGEKSNLYIFASIGVLILVMASINYMNLATARSIRRSKEVGLRKTLGVGRGTLVLQFFGESLLITVIALGLAILLCVVLLPYFNDLTGKNFSVTNVLGGNVFPWVAALTVTVGLISGSYPAFYLSSFNSAAVLKGKLQTGVSAEGLRQILVVAQFSITLLLLASTLVIRNQMQFVNKSKLSEFEDQIFSVRLTGLIDPASIQAVKKELLTSPYVADVALATHLPRQEQFGWSDVRLKAPLFSETEFIWQVIDCSHDFPKMFDLTFLSGRSFTGVEATDTTQVIINESAVHDLQLDPDHALGVTLEDPFSKKKRTIVGVVKDFNCTSARKKIQPMVINCNVMAAEHMYIRLSGPDYQQAIGAIQQTWRKISPKSPFEYSFMNEQFAALYRSERQASAIVSYFSMLAIMIGCLGLFGLAAFTTEQRSKEIGIRKVLGASSRQIVVLLTSKYVRLVSLSFVIGMPVAIILVNQWLEQFEYRIELDVFFYVVPVILIMVLVTATVSFEALRAAYANPVDSIKSEH